MHIELTEHERTLRIIHWLDWRARANTDTHRSRTHTRHIAHERADIMQGTRIRENPVICEMLIVAQLSVCGGAIEKERLDGVYGTQSCIR